LIHLLAIDVDSGNIIMDESTGIDGIVGATVCLGGRPVGIFYDYYEGKIKAVVRDQNGYAVKDLGLYDMSGVASNTTHLFLSLGSRIYVYDPDLNLVLTIQPYGSDEIQILDYVDGYLVVYRRYHVPGAGTVVATVIMDDDLSEVASINGEAYATYVDGTIVYVMRGYGSVFVGVNETAVYIPALIDFMMVPVSGVAFMTGSYHIFQIFRGEDGTTYFAAIVLDPVEPETTTITMTTTVTTTTTVIPGGALGNALPLILVIVVAAGIALALRGSRKVVRQSVDEAMHFVRRKRNT